MRLALAKWSLGPLLLAQGGRVRRTTPVLPEPPGAREGATGTGPLLRVLVLGDSAGAGTVSTARHLERVEPFATDAVVTSLGVNDVTGDVGAARFVEAQHRLHGLLREKFGARLILASGIPPMERFPALPQPLRWYLGARARELDRALAQALPDGLGAEYLPLAGELDAAHMAADGFHPGPEVYAAWGAAAASRIARAFSGGGAKGPAADAEERK